MTRRDGVVTVNGRVHAICRAPGRKPAIYQVFTDHFEKCSSCKVYSNLEEWENDQARIVFTSGLDNTIVCGVSCARCSGYSGKLLHSYGSRIPKKVGPYWGMP